MQLSAVVVDKFTDYVLVSFIKINKINKYVNNII